jgi:poly(A) polymerase
MYDDFLMELLLIFMGKEEVIELYPMLDSEVPIMKFKLNGISIDLVYARLLLWPILDVNVLHFL